MIPIFIVRYKMPDIEHRCLEAVSRYTDLRKAESVVQDNGLKNRNLAAIWNEMIEMYDGWKRDLDPVGILLNTDCFVTLHWLDKLERAIRISEKIGFVGPMTNNCGGFVQKAPPGYNPQLYKNKIILDQMISGFCLMFRQRAWKEADRFPEDSPFYGQETALIWNAMHIGWRTAIVLDCWVEHLGSASVRAAEIRGEMNYEEERWKGKNWFEEYKHRSIAKTHSIE